MPADIHLGEVAGVATNSKGHLFVYTRTGNPTVGLGNSRLFTHGGSRLFEFDANGNFVREIGQGALRLLVAQACASTRRTTSGSSTRVEPGHEVQSGRAGADDPRPQARSDHRSARLGCGRGAHPHGRTWRRHTRRRRRRAINSSRPSDVAWDAEGNIFVADGHGPNARIAKFDRDGRFLAVVGLTGQRAGPVRHAALDRDRRARATSTSPTRATSAFRSSTTTAPSKSQITNVGVPTALCISPGPHQYLYSSHTGDAYGMDDAAIYKLELDGTVVGTFGTAGKQMKEFGLVNAIDCRVDNTLYVGELSNWRVQKFTIR